METSLFLAKAIGLYFVLFSLFILIRHKALADIMREITAQPGFMLISGIITLVLGILLVISHNVWVSDWRIIITIIAWLIFVSGIIRLFFFDAAKPIAEWWIKHRSFLIGFAIIYLIIGFYLLYVIEPILPNFL